MSQTILRRGRSWRSILLLVILFIPAQVFAQKQPEGFDATRMERDIGIMERILDMLVFGDTSSRITIGRPQTRGLHIPDFGLVFEIPTPSFVYGYLYDLQGKRIDAGKEVHVFATESDDSSGSDNPKRLLSAVEEFLANYVDAVGQLSPNDRIMVVQSPGQEFQFLRSSRVFSGAQSTGFAVIATKANVVLVRSRKMSDEVFRQKLKIENLDDKGQRGDDLQILAKIFETALQSKDHNAFSISGNITDLYLDDFGALLFFDANYANSDFVNILRLDAGKKAESRNAAKQVRDQLARQKEALEKQMTQRGTGANVWQQMAKQDSMQLAYTQKAYDNALSVWQQWAQQDTTRWQNARKAYDEFEKNVASYLLDYGRTLRIVKPDQRVIVAVKVQGNPPGVPERVIFQVKKAVLDAYDARSLSKEKALQQVVIRRYGENLGG